MRRRDDRTTSDEEDEKEMWPSKNEITKLETVVNGCDPDRRDADPEPGTYAAEAVVSETAVGDVVVITVDSAQYGGSLTATTATLADSVGAVQLAVHGGSSESGFRSVEVAKTSVYSNQ